MVWGKCVMRSFIIEGNGIGGLDVIFTMAMAMARQYLDFLLYFPSLLSLGIFRNWNVLSLPLFYFPVFFPFFFPFLFPVFICLFFSLFLCQCFSCPSIFA